jgi:hypothetical protein
MPTVVAITRSVVSSLGVSAAVVALSLVPQAHAQDAVQWRVEDGGNGHWYLMSTGEQISWDSSRRSAISMGGDLATVTTQAECDFVAVITSSVDGWVPYAQYFVGPWLGGFQPAGSPEPNGDWTWVSGEPWVFTQWLSPEPNDAYGTGGGEDHLCLLTQPPYFGPSRWWNDAPGNSSKNLIRSFVVEWSADCNQDGVVDFGQIRSGQLADWDVNGVPDVCEVDPCPGDVTNGGSVDATDLSVILAAWGTNGQGEFDADADNSGLVDGGDLALVLSGWGPCPQ